MTGERRIVTMLFCDLKGSTAAAERVDPEEWADIMNGAFAHLIAPVYRYEGTLARLMGDAILAFFGAPIAHEDDPERAVLAGLDIVQEIRPYIERIRATWGIDLDVRVGINTGLVMVGAVGSDLRVEYTAMGDAVNLAARMEQTAEPGTVRVAEATWRSVSRLFSATPIGPVEVKGKAEPVLAWRVLGAAERPASERGIAGLEAPMIGRDQELAALVGSLTALRGGCGGVVSVQGEAGLGKSRLVAEWRKTAGDDVAWREGRSLSYQTSAPYTPFRAILRNLLGLREGTASSDDVRAVIAPWFPADPDSVAGPLASLMGLELRGEAAERVRYLDPAGRHERELQAASDVFRAAAERQPTVVVLEDLHWADSASLALASRLQDVAVEAPLLLVAMFRPRHDEPSWQFHAGAEQRLPHRYRAVVLSPLEPDHARELVGSLLRIDGLPVRVRELILERAEGNPFFVEEVIRTLLDAGLVVRDGETWRATAEIASIEVPATLAGVLTARLDRLEDAHRRVAQVAAVIGREFDFGTLSAVSPDAMGLHRALAELERRGIVRELGRSGTRRFRFKHGLTRDAAYETLLHKHRRELHLAVAELWERTGVDRTSEIAQHFLAGRAVDRALPWMVKAAEQAARAFALPEARRWYREALSHADPARHLALVRTCWEGLHDAARHGFDVRGVIEAADALIALGDERGDVGAGVSGRNKKGFASGMMLGDMVAGAALLAEAEARARAASDPVGLLECSMYQCYLQTGQGNFSQVEHYMSEVSRSAAEMNATDQQLFGMAHLASALLSSTRYDEAMAQARDTLELAERVGHRMWVAELMCWVLPLCHLRAGEVEVARDFVRRGTSMALEVGAFGDAALGLLVQAELAGRLGAYDEAFALLPPMLDAAARTGMPFVMAVTRCRAGSTWVEAGGAELAPRALPEHERTAEAMALPTGPVYFTWLCAELGACSLATGKPDVARQLFEDALTVPNASMHLRRPQALRGRAALALHLGDDTAAEADWRACDTYVRAREMRHELPETCLLGARVALLRGGLREAVALAAEAESVARSLGFQPAVLRALALRAVANRRLGVDTAAIEADARSLAIELGSRLPDDDARAGFDRYVTSLLA